MKPMRFPGRCLDTGLVKAAMAGACLLIAGTAAAQERVDTSGLWQDLRVLAADSLEGRATGTPGSARARQYLVERVRRIGLEPVGGSYEHPFVGSGRPGVAGTNVTATQKGRENEAGYLVVSAHYDHVGIRNRQVYNGADDNASGVAAALAAAAYFRDHPTRHRLLFAFFDAEEVGLQGSAAFVQEPPVPLEQIVLNVNLDMVARGDTGRLVVAGTFPYPHLAPIVREAVRGSAVPVFFGFDRPDQKGQDNWSFASDHGSFHRRGIPFLYFGVDEHRDYHRPTDDVERIEHGFYEGAVDTIIRVIEAVDRKVTLGRR